MIEIEAECSACGRGQRIQLEMSDTCDLLKIKVPPCYGCVRTLISDGLTEIKKKVDSFVEKGDTSET